MSRAVSRHPFDALAEAPHRHDFFDAMRRIEAHFPDRPRLGTGRRPADEPLRLGQAADMSFAPAALSAFVASPDGRPPRLEVRFLGLFGPGGPLPLHLTEYARDRLLHHGDATLARFADLFHHRMLLLFYRAWAQAQPTVSLDRPSQDRFADYVGSLIGIGRGPLQKRDAAPDHAKLHFAGLLSRGVRNADGLASLVAGYLRLPVRLESFVGHWMRLPASERTRLDAGGNPGSRLGVGAVLGRQVWDRQHKFRLHVGPLTLSSYESLLPGGPGLDALRALVRQYLGMELDWDLRLALEAPEVPRTRLGGFARLGWTTWLGERKTSTAADPLTLHPESMAVRPRTGSHADSRTPAAGGHTLHTDPPGTPARP